MPQQASRRRRALAGAWIETIMSIGGPAAIEVAPSRARGLKPLAIPQASKASHVAPSRARGLKPMGVGITDSGDGRALAGAWIET